jgi:uncharacterized protein YjdB
MADNKRFTDGNVAWEESCDNIILVDPNKIYDKKVFQKVLYTV